MKKIAAATGPKVEALKAINAFLADERLARYSLKEHVMWVLGGPEHCRTAIYATRDAINFVLQIIEPKNHDLFYDRAKEMLDNLLILCNNVLEDSYVEAELTSWVVEADDSMTTSKHLSDEYLANLAKQYELMRQLEAMKSEGNSILDKYRQQKKAA